MVANADRPGALLAPCTQQARRVYRPQGDENLRARSGCTVRGEKSINCWTGETPTCQMGGGPLKCGDKDLSSLQSYLKAISSQQRNVSFSWIGFAHVVQRNGRAELVQIPLSGWHRQLDYQRCLDKVLLHSIFHVIKSC